MQHSLIIVLSIHSCTLLVEVYSEKCWGGALNQSRDWIIWSKVTEVNSSRLIHSIIPLPIIFPFPIHQITPSSFPSPHAPSHAVFFHLSGFPTLSWN